MNQLRDKKTGQYVSMKKATEIEPDKIIDIWLKEEPKEQDALKDHRRFAEILFIYVATIFVIVSTFYILFRW